MSNDLTPTKPDAKNGPEPGSPEVSDVHTAMTLLREHGPFLGLALGAVVAVSLGWTLLRIRGARAATEAALQLAQAETAEEFSAVAERFPRTASGPLASLGLAAEWFHEGRYDEAAAEYDRFLARYADHPMAGAAKLNRIACDEAAGRWADARSGYEALIEGRPGPHIAPQAALGLGRVFVAEGKAGAARAVLEDFLLQDPVSPWLPQVESALREVNRHLRGSDG